MNGPLADVLVAGAGTGKTYALVTRVLAHLEGVHPASVEALSPRALLVVTFTKKAAGELSDRIRQRVRKLATGAEDQALADLAGDRERRPAEFWTTEVLPHLGDMFVGTFHAFGRWVLSNHAVEAGLPPDFVVLPPDDAAEHLRAAVEDAVLTRLGDGDAQVSGLLARVPVDLLVKSLVDVRHRLANEGRDPSTETLSTPVDNVEPGARGREHLTSALRSLLEAGDALAAVDVDRLTEKTRAAVEGFSKVWQSSRQGDGARACLTALLDAPEQHRDPAAELTLARLRRATPAARSKAIREAAKALKAAQDLLREAQGAAELGPLYPALGAMLAVTEARYRDAKERLKATDNEDLLLRARDLLRDHEGVRKSLQGRFRAVLVDEFQDTNLVQLELVSLMAYRRDAPLPEGPVLPPPLGDVELTPGILTVVGDPKQAIYEFRGADVSVFRAAIEGLTDRPTRLTVNRRSVPGIIEFANALCHSMFEDVDGARVYDPAVDDLSALRDAEAPAAVEILEVDEAHTGTADAHAGAAANAIACRARALVAAGQPPQTIAVLARSAAVLSRVQLALQKHGVAAVIAGGSGLYRTQEVADVTALARVLVDPQDTAALAQALRSPLVGLDDAQLLRLAYNLATDKDVGRHLAADLPATIWGARGVRARGALPSSVRDRLETFTRAVRQRVLEIDRLGLTAALDQVLDITRFRAVLAAEPRGEVALANVERLLDILEDEDPTSAAQQVRRLEARVESEASERPGVVEPEGGAVRLMTIHASKGLEFPVVFLAGLSVSSPPELARVRYHRSTGLLLADDHLHARDGIERLKQQRRSEELRLLYVAVTRARDTLILAGMQRPRRGTWARTIEAALAGASQVNDAVLRIPPPRPRAGGLPVPVPIGEGPAALATLARHLGSNRPARRATVRVDATQLASAWACPRRHLLLERWAAAPEALSGGFRTRHVGRHIMRLLEAVAERGPLFSQAALTSALRALGLDGSAEAGQAAAQTLERLAAAPLAARLLGAEPACDLPYTLAPEDGVVITGSIPLLALLPDGGALAVSVDRESGSVAARRRVVMALAARALVPEAATVEVASLDLTGRDPLGPQTFTRDDLEDLARQAGAQAQALEALAPAAPPEIGGVPVDECASMRCPFVERCHPVADRSRLIG